MSGRGRSTYGGEYSPPSIAATRESLTEAYQRDYGGEYSPPSIAARFP